MSASIRDGRPEPAAQRSVAGLPVRLPALDVHTIGAGGGSIALIDAGGALVVGPASAGADPGPACYGRGGERGHRDRRRPGGRPHPGVGRPARPGPPRRGRRPSGPWSEPASTPTRSSPSSTPTWCGPCDGSRWSAASTRAGLALVAFGGAGPLHACALADALEMSSRDRSAPGRSPLGRRAAGRAPPGGPGPELGRSPGSRAAPSRRRRNWPKRPAGPCTGAAGTELSFDCRYVGQSHELTVARVADFEAEHQRRNGFARRGTPVEVIALRAAAWLALARGSGRPARSGDEERHPIAGRRSSPRPTAPSGWLPVGRRRSVEEGRGS